MASAIMLIGIVSVFSSMFFLVNHSHEEVQDTAWKVVGTTMNIFCAVISFFALNKATTAALGDSVPVLVGVAVVCSAACQWMIFFSQEREGEVGGVSAAAVSTHTFGALFADVAACSWSFLFGEVMARGPAHHYVPYVLMSLPFWFALMAATRAVRHWVVLAWEGDGVVEVTKEEAAWEVHATEAETEGGGLFVSFLLVQVIRFYIGGALPDAEGTEQKDGAVAHSFPEVLRMLLVGAVAVVVTVVTAAPAHEAVQGPAGPPLTRAWCVQTLRHLGAQTASMTVSWSLLVSTQWWVDTTFFEGRQAGVIVRLIVAVAASYLTFGTVLLYDSFAGRGHTARVTKRNVTTALGLMVGFAWERAFDTAIEDAALSMGSTDAAHLIAALALTAYLCSITLPAIYYHINPRILAKHHAHACTRTRTR